jgi:hypothetical protein
MTVGSRSQPSGLQFALGLLREDVRAFEDLRPEGNPHWEPLPLCGRLSAPRVAGWPYSPRVDRLRREL